ncbi:hypothetical protein BCR34DRAFT_555532 [Clohesyomyces aquaticus]|uniref:F-box domain-containing protein n=1 Tax=Clohesyomyces aquaticus TaxID=1231657 RepID=A0A1Y2A4P5_9PLEO|nr:hypothetical protein BCR34DRAFT_555532 [Clohesyomyces aquaticus]
MPGPSLLDLPVELLQRIARLCPCSSVLSLIRVNRQLHHACNDRFVFKYIAENSHLEFHADLETWDSSLILKPGSLADTIRVAAAVEKAITYIEEFDHRFSDIHGLAKELHNEAPLDLCNWLPHLIALRLPICLQLKGNRLRTTFLSLQKPFWWPLGVEKELISRLYATNSVYDPRLKSEEVEYVTLAFCLTAIALERAAAMPTEDQDRQNERWSAELNCKTDMVGATLSNMLPMYSSALVSANVPIKMAAGLVRLPLYTKDAPLPSPSRIPFFDLMNIPLPFQNTAERFTTCHIEKMTTHEFLTGEWVGYYDDLRLGMPDSRRSYLDPPMRDIRIIAGPFSPTSRTHCVEKTRILQGSRGVDSVGEFGLTGTVYADGRVRLQKRYLSRPWLWVWSGEMTPFGIVGTWGDGMGRVDAARNNYFWIWKKEWCEFPSEES